MTQILLSISQTANLLNCSSATVARYIRSGKLNAIRNLYHCKIDLSELERFVEEMNQNGSELRIAQTRNARASLDAKRKRINLGASEEDARSFSDEYEYEYRPDGNFNNNLKELLSMYSLDEEDDYDEEIKS